MSNTFRTQCEVNLYKYIITNMVYKTLTLINLPLSKRTWTKRAQQNTTTDNKHIDINKHK